MKKILYILPVLALLFGSCNLDEKSKTEMEIGDYMRDASEAERVLLGVYQPMTSQFIYGYHLSLLFPLGTDLAQVEGSVTSSPREIPTNFHNASTKEINQTWNALYNAVYNANHFLTMIQAKMPAWSSSADRQLGEYYIAEVRALRALYYFELLRWFGNVALVTDISESYQPNDYFEQAAPEKVLAFIEADLKYAAEILPWATEDHVRSNNSYRFSRGGVLGLLTKVYVMWAGYPVRDESKWAEAAKTAKTLVESGRHGLLTDCKKVWENAGGNVWDPTESLIEASFYWSSYSGGEPVGMIGKWNGVITSQVGNRGTCQARARIVYPFVLKWQAELPNDPRVGLSVADYCYGYLSTFTFNGTKYELIKTDGKQNYMEALDIEAKLKEKISGKVQVVTEEARNKQRARLYTPAKWDVERYASSSPLYSNNYNSTTNWYVLRYSDVLLLYAEALNESQGPIETAHAALNAVRRRALGNTSKDVAGLSQEELRQAIRRERGYELCFEGHRKSDLIRWGVYTKTIRQTAQDIVDWYTEGTYLVATYTQEGRHELMPIPQTQLELMPKFKQNPGWGK